MRMLGDLASVEELAQALSNAATETRDAMSSSRAAMVPFDSQMLQGETVDKVRAQWQQLDGSGARLGGEMESVSKAISTYSGALATAQDDLSKAAVLAHEWGLDTHSDGRLVMPHHLAPFSPEHVQKMQDAVSTANAYVDKAETDLADAAKKLITVLNAARAALGDHRILAYDGDFRLLVGSFATGLYSAPEATVKTLAQDAERADHEASKWGRLLRSGNDAERSQAGRELKAAGRSARDVNKALDDAPGWFSRLPGGSVLSKNLGDIKFLKGLKFGEDIPILGLVFATAGTIIDYEQTDEHGHHESLLDAAATNFGGAAAGAAAGAAVALAFGTASLASTVAVVAVGGVVALGVGQFIHHAIDDHGNLVEAGGQTVHDIGSTASRAWHDATGWL